MAVPLMDLKLQYRNMRSEADAAMQRVLDNAEYILGSAVDNFEKEFAKFCNARDCAAVDSGTAALHLALLARGIRIGDEVITTPFTFIATAEAVSHCGAKPVFVDVESETLCIDPAKVEAAITKRTKAILPVHLYGHPAEMKPLAEIAEKHSLLLVEDCCQAHGAEYKGKRAPVSGIGCFSFYPSKNLGAFGEGGAIVGNDPDFMEKVRLLRAHGEKPKNTHNLVGYNYRMHGLQGAVLGMKLKHLEEWNNARRKHAKLYNRELSGIVEIPVERKNAKHVYHLYVVRTAMRDALKKFLDGRSIGNAVHYPCPIHMQPAYSSIGQAKGMFPAAETAAQRVISLPMYPELSKEQLSEVCDAAKEFFKKAQK